MAFKGFNGDTLKELGKVGGEVGDQDKVATVADNLPDIDLVDITDPKLGAAVKAEPKVEKVDKDVKPDVTSASDKDSKKSTDVGDKVIVDTLTEAGFKFEDIQKRIIKEGKISKELEAELKEKIDPDKVDGYIKEFNDAKDAAEIKAKADATKAGTDDVVLKAFNTAQKKRNDYIYASVGGEDKFNVLASVLKSNLDDKSLKLLNTKLKSEDQTLVEDGMADAVAHYKKITGRGGKLMGGDGGVIKEAALPFMSKSEYKRTVTTEKYKTDSVYRDKVDKSRLASISADEATTMPGQYRNVRNGEMYNI